MNEINLLKIEDLSAGYKNGKDILHKVSLTVRRGKIVGIVGESGCGKSTLVKAILGMDIHALQYRGGRIRYNGMELTTLPFEEYRKIRGNEIGMIVQDSISSLNPIKKIKNQMIELLREKKGTDSKTAMSLGAEMLSRLHCPDNLMEKYPFQMSGGQRQRVMIAMAFLLQPKMLLADEPTTALDVTIQAQILKEMKNLRDIYQTGIILISHNLGVIAQVADEIGIMYQGEIVEYGITEEILKHPGHPYTKALIRCIPDMRRPDKRRLFFIPEDASQSDEVNGCCFAGRCSECRDMCREVHPSGSERRGGWVQCHLWNLEK